MTGDACEIRSLYEQAAERLMNCLVVEPDPVKRGLLKRRIETYRQGAADAVATDERQSRMKQLIDLSSDLKTVIVHASQSGAALALTELRDLAEQVDEIVHQQAADETGSQSAPAP